MSFDYLAQYTPVLELLIVARFHLVWAMELTSECAEDRVEDALLAVDRAISEVARTDIYMGLPKSKIILNASRIKREGPWPDYPEGEK